MISKWPMIRLCEVLEITSSKRIKRADYVEMGIPFFRSKEVIERSKGNEISTELFITEEQFYTIKNKFCAPVKGDILLTSVGTLGVAYQVRDEDKFYFKDGNLTWFRNYKDCVNPEFVFYWLCSPEAQQKLDEVSIGSTQKALTIVSLKSIEMPLPPLSVQCVVVDILQSISRRLESNRKISQTL